MAEMSAKRSSRRMRIRHRGRGAQVWIYLGKLLRMFVYQSDWKVLPMAALIAGLVGMVIRRRFPISMEGTLMGSFAIVCVCIWNGCFNSIQVICRERDVIKREHRSGMHISSYICAHVIYQALLCLAQTGVTLYVTRLTGVKYPVEGVVTKFFLVDFGISLFLITFASDMMSLWISSLAHTTTAAMTIMPFVLIFQLVFSGGMMTLPAWTEPLTYLTISNPGLKVVAAQGDTNHRPYATISTLVSKMRNSELSVSVTLGQVLDALSQADNETVARIRATELGGSMTVGELRQMLKSSGAYAEMRTVEIQQGLTLGDVADLVDASGALDQYDDVLLDARTTIGELVDGMAEQPEVIAQRDEPHTFVTTMGSVLDLVGEDKVKTFLEQKAAEANYAKQYDREPIRIMFYWGNLLAFVLGFAVLSVITLEFIDHDKR